MMSPAFIIGGSFLFWLAMTKKLPAYMALMQKPAASS